jgi:hypothetical protein
MGGSNDPSNLITLTITEHAEAHKKLWEQHGLWQDWCAWQSLSGQITNQEAIRYAQRMGQLGRPRTEKQLAAVKLNLEKARQANIGAKRSEESRLRMSVSHLGHTPWNKGRKMTEEEKQKRIDPSTGRFKSL